MMPRVRRKHLARKRDLLCDAMFRSLETGTFSRSEWDCNKPTMAEKREAWEALRDELMSAWALPTVTVKDPTTPTYIE